MDNDREIVWLQSLRGIAALCIVLVHTRFEFAGMGPASQWIADRLFKPLALGVDLFFIISGFIMVVTTVSFDPQYKIRYAIEFAIKRFARVWPMYALVVLVMYVVQTSHATADAPTLAVVIRNLLFVPIDPTEPLYFNMLLPVAWTLCFECYFYVVLSTSFLFGRWRWCAIAVWFTGTLLVYPIISGSLNWNVFAQKPVEWNHYANLVVNPIVWDFIFGMLCAALYRSSITIRSRRLVNGMIGLSGAALLIEGVLTTASIHGPAGWGLPCFMFVASWVLSEKIQHTAWPAWTVRLGAISYSLYLTHLLSFRVSYAVLGHLDAQGSVMRAVVTVLLRTAVSIAVASIAYALVERPLSRYVRHALLDIARPFQGVRVQ
ncbi:MAG TPA: acyltransferase [Pararobbsia sp.]|nr:acyltransferase [Pararobbsia sp.]